jgi:inner membrane transporter RhtA
MSKLAPRTASPPPWGLALAAMLAVQLGSALSVPLIASVGPAGTAWLKLSAGALIFLVLARPPLRAVRLHDVPALLGLGITTGLTTVAAVRSHSARALTWPAMALLGVVLLTEPWQGDVNSAGVAFAGLSAIGWGAYILFTQRIGDRFTGIGVLSITVTIAAATAAIVGIARATERTGAPANLDLIGDAAHLRPTGAAINNPG